MKRTTITVTEAARNFADCINRAHYQNTSFVLLKNGRFQLDGMDPGDVRQVALTFEVQPQLAEDEVVLGLSVGDRDLREYANEKIRIPVRAAAVIDALPAAVAGALAADRRASVRQMNSLLSI